MYKWDMLKCLGNWPFFITTFPCAKEIIFKTDRIHMCKLKLEIEVFSGLKDKASEPFV